MAFPICSRVSTLVVTTTTTSSPSALRCSIKGANSARNAGAVTTSHCADACSFSACAALVKRPANNTKTRVSIFLMGRKLKRQQALIEQLDLNKNQAANTLDANQEAAEVAQYSETISQNPSIKRERGIQV